MSISVIFTCLCISFFIQAEDGIRDGHVTGVQTCALPISTFVMTAVFLVLVVALIVWANTRPVTPRHFVRLHTTMILSWAVCYTLGLLIGRLYFMENPTWWILAAAATALPGLIVALVSLRQSRSAL